MISSVTQDDKCAFIWTAGKMLFLGTRSRIYQNCLEKCDRDSIAHMQFNITSNQPNRQMSVFTFRQVDDFCLHFLLSDLIPFQVLLSVSIVFISFLHYVLFGESRILFLARKKGTTENIVKRPNKNHEQKSAVSNSAMALKPYINSTMCQYDALLNYLSKLLQRCFIPYCLVCVQVYWCFVAVSLYLRCCNMILRVATIASVNRITSTTTLFMSCPFGRARGCRL